MTASPDRYDPLARGLHWLAALLILFTIPAGIIMGRLPGGPLQDTLFDLHRSVGFTLLPLMLLRLLYRLRHPPPPLPDSLPVWQRLTAGFTHGLLYIGVIANALLGWWGTSAFGAAISVFWLFELPALTAKDEAAAKLVLGLHGWVGFALAAAILLHVGAALMHHLVWRDGILRRML